MADWVPLPRLWEERNYRDESRYLMAHKCNQASDFSVFTCRYWISAFMGRYRLCAAKNIGENKEQSHYI